VIAAWSVPLAILAAIYMGTTITAAIRTEEAFLRRTFGDAYDRYQQSRGARSSRQFSLERVLRNREYRAAIGLVRRVRAPCLESSGADIIVLCAASSKLMVWCAAKMCACTERTGRVQRTCGLARRSPPTRGG
jgi:hypothetical protein